ncbi:hypothetical protein [Frankia sp. AgW1.1]|uniref:hypothetical protein n=1 Tax=Frankia sp. AgW1.1 TaxID=1836971 RepID=UPI0019320BFD|nr:hypothetical protein [Frankia sp. AgW1.1]
MVLQGGWRPRVRAWSRRARRLLSMAGAALLLAVCGSSSPAGAATSAPSPGATGEGVPGIDVRPGWQGMPGQDKIQTFLDVASQLGLACCIGSVVIGGAALGVGRATGAGQASGRGLGMVLGGGGGAVLILLAPSLIGWMSR